MERREFLVKAVTGAVALSPMATKTPNRGKKPRPGQKGFGSSPFGSVPFGS